MPAGSSGAISRRAALSLIALATTACTKLALFAANVPATFGSYTRHANVAYGNGPHHTLDVYVPDTPSSLPRPLIVFWYGGRWEGGDKDDYKFVGATFAEQGYVVMLPNYRHYPEVKLAGFMDDAARAAVWAVEHARDYGADARQVYLSGHSSGAHIAALLALDTRYLAAVGRGVPVFAGVMGLSGPYDFLPLTDDDLKDMFGPPDNYPNSQPIHFVHRGAPPMLLIQGLSDKLVATKNSVNLAAALRADDVPVVLKLYPNCSHADTVAALSVPARRREPTLADMLAFLKSTAAAATGGPVGVGRVSPPPSS
jgi:acetyl esterase/lipase